MEDLEILVGGVEILGAPRDRTRPNGLIVKPDGLQGWQGLPAGRRESLARAVGHGEHDAPVYLPSRVVTIDGWALADSGGELEHLGDRVVGVGATGDPLRATVRKRGDTKWADGRRLLCEFEDSGRRAGSFYGEFQLQFVFADPRRYGATATLPAAGGAGTTISVYHYGNFPAYPVIEIPAAPASYTITAGGKAFTVSGATAGGAHRVDLRSGRVYRDGVEMPGVGVGDLWAVQAGTALTHTLSVAGRVLITDTFI